MPGAFQVYGARTALLLDLELQGRVFRYSSYDERIEVEDSAGVVHTYLPGLQTGFVASVVGDLEEADIAIPGAKDDPWARLVARGYAFDDARATVRRWYAGLKLDLCAVLIRGWTTGSSYGGPDTPLTFTVERQLRRSGTIGDAAAVVDDTTWPVTYGAQLDEAAIGRCYPIIIGRPGRILYQAYNAEVAEGVSPGHLVEFNESSPELSKLVIADGEIAASTVKLTDKTGQFARTRTVKTTQDALGRTVSYIDWQNLSGQWRIHPQPGNEYRIGFPSGGGVVGDDGTELRGLGEVVLWMAREWGRFDIDIGAFKAHQAFLDRFRVDAFIDQRPQLWDWLQSHVLGVFPVEWVEGPRGGYLLPFAFMARREEATVHLDSTPDAALQAPGSLRVARTQDPTAVGGSPANRITLRYGLAGSELQLRRRLVAAAEKSDTDARVLGHALCRISRSLLENPERGDDGVRELEVESYIVVDEDVAELVLQWLVWQHAVTRHQVVVSGGHELDLIEAGEVLRWSDAELFVDDALVQVRRKHTTDQGVTLRLLRLDNPVAALREVGP